MYKTCETCNGTGKVIDDVKTGAYLRKQRESVDGASLRRVAAICNWSAAYLSDLEKGRRRWNLEKISRFTEAVETFK